MHLRRQDFIPAGCLGIPLIQPGIEAKTWKSPGLRRWKTIRHSQCADRYADNHVDQDHLPLAVQKQLISSGSLLLVARLLKACWVDLEFRVSSDVSYGILRVYLLPDDMHQELVDRTDHALRKARRRLLHSLDYSESAWAGHFTVSGTKLNPFVRHDCAGEESASLLQVFNDIPSPNPDPNLVSDLYSRKAINEIISGDVQGLVTELYPYQRKSTALMVQKEAEPGTVLDPRLVAVKDQHGSLWYADALLGTVLKAPRYYEGIAGGILAEEMGSGKTVICLALILATRALPTRPPEAYRRAGIPTRPRAASLADMAASCATRNSIPWRCYFETWRHQLGYDFGRCEQVLRRNPGYYFQPTTRLRRSARRPIQEPPSIKLLLSNATMIVVPNNLVSQWKQEIVKHTTGLDICFLTGSEGVPCLEKLLDLDILFFSQSRFERLVRDQRISATESKLSVVHFKRCIVDEGHKLGNSKINRKSDLLSGIDGLSFSSKWIVTGTPSHGLFGVDGDAHGSLKKESPETSAKMEKKDLERLGSITALYLKAKPWAMTTAEGEDTRADWGTYLLLPRHHKKSRGNWNCLKATLNSLIIRHRLSDVRDLLPSVDEKVIVLEGSYQDKLSLNLFAMMIIFNSVQSQRTDMDYFFHPKQRRSLLEIVHNLKQSSFFGGSFFTSEEVAKSVETAEKFLEEGKVPIGDDDRELLLQAISLGKLAADDKLRNLSNRYHEMPILVRGQGLLGDIGHAWSLDGECDDLLCTSASLVLSLQKLLSKAAHDPASLNSLLNGGLSKKGLSERNKIVAAQDSSKASGKRGRKAVVLAGNTRLGEDVGRPKSRHQAAGVDPAERFPVDSLPMDLRGTNLVSTVSAKLSYLLDSVLHHQEKEKMIIFYENENVAWYLASMLDMLQVQHLIYAKSLTVERKAQYVDAFHQNHAFRVLLMDLSQAAFGLDMREASRVYFINPVLNPQVEAQAIGRVRRISQQKPVSVETLVLKDSIDEVILERKRHMTQAEHGRVKSILDVRPIYNWIKNSKIVKLPPIDGNVASHMVDLQSPTPIFGREQLPPDDELVTSSTTPPPVAKEPPPRPLIPKKRTRSSVVVSEASEARARKVRSGCGKALRPAKKLRFLSDPDSSG
ncbi:hypothetical protein E4U41_002369 [Claviceps citrina]|nr:hypothetical protein E4U41_002369 [Claviceps citrina]